MYLYQSHMGGLYCSDYLQSIEETYCEQCGDYDWYLGNYDSAIEILKDLADEIDANDGHGGYAIEDVLNTLYVFEDFPDYNTAIEIVRNNRAKESEDEEC